MMYKLLIGQKSYSSWSLRGWLPFAIFDIPVEVSSAVIYSDAFADDVAAFGGSKTVPAVVTPDGGMLSDSLAIAWHLAEAFPEKQLLPSDPIQRAKAMSITAEMHSGFTALRGACPMNLRNGWEGFVPSPKVLADLARIEAIWKDALDMSGGPFLFGGYSIADAFYAPIATRIVTYDLPVSAQTQSYIDAHLALPQMKKWREDGLREDEEVTVYNRPLERRPFPMPS